MKITRREFLKGASLLGLGFLVGKEDASLSLLEKIPHIENPMEHYPFRDWEKTYHDQYRYDSSFTYICSPNDTHSCRVKGIVRNGVVVRLEPPYDQHKSHDLYGNFATQAWNPRMCLKGYTFHQRVYGPYRLKSPLIRKGWKRWADDSFPDLTQDNLMKYKFTQRGEDIFLPVTWDEAFTYAAKGMIAVAKRYSGSQGAKKLRSQGYPEEMIQCMKGAGVQTFKLRPGMPILGIIGKGALARLGNSLALLDSFIRGVNEKESRGARLWSNYTWHGDQAPGFPFVHGLQASDLDMNGIRYSRLIIQVGKNLIENKMPDAHWLLEATERGGKLITISPEYSPPASKSDRWIPIRPQTDTAFFLGVTKIIIDNKLYYDEEFMKKFSDLPLLVRTDTLKRLKPSEVFPDYVMPDLSNGPSMGIQGMTKEQRERVGDFVLFDSKTQRLKGVTRDDIGEVLTNNGIDPQLEVNMNLTLISGENIEVMSIFYLYKEHLKDYSLDTVSEITGSPKEAIKEVANDLASIKPAAIHFGEGINHWFHATEATRAFWFPLILTGNIGKKGAGCFTWAGNYKKGAFQGSPWSGPGLKVYTSEDPFNPNLIESLDGKDVPVKEYTKGEEPAYWNYGDRPLIVNTPKYGKKIFTGKSHMPAPTKLEWHVNVNHLNNSKWAYEMIKNVEPFVELIICQEIELTASCEYSDIVLPASTWMEFENMEMTASCSHPFLEIWKGGIPPVYNTKDDMEIIAGVAKKLGELTKDNRFISYWKFAHEKKPEVYIQRILDASVTTRGYKVNDILNNSGSAIMNYRTTPRLPFYEQVHDSIPFYTPTGRLQVYNDESEVIEYGENFIVHREGPEATPYLPNVIVSTNPYIRPDDYGIPKDSINPDHRQIRNIKMGWNEVKKTKNPLWKDGFTFYCLTPKTRHKVHSQWSICDWNLIWDSQFGDPFREDKRTPGVGEQYLNMNPKAARDLGVQDGDYVFVDANNLDRPYKGCNKTCSKKDPFYKVSRLLIRVKYNPAYSYNVAMIRHSGFMATPSSIKGHETRKDKRAVGPSGYQATFRFGSQQSLTRSWLMPLHQLDSLFHKKEGEMKFIFGYEADNHAVNTVPKETLVKITKAGRGGKNGIGIWEGAKTGYSPAREESFMWSYLNGETIVIE